uniref:Putative tumor protein d54-like isoform x5 n=1 Tax=Tabanus bromius TaxID=304241 RepID=A0A0K8TQQ2_TABBR
MSENEPVSLEFIEDPYIPKLDNCNTPSLDEPTEFYENSCDWSEETELYLRSLTLDQILVDTTNYDSFELQTVEAEFGKKVCPPSKRWRLKFFTKRSMRDVKVTFIDFSKPYFAKISSSENYKKFLNIGSQDNLEKMSEPSSPASVASADIAAEFASLTVEEQERQRAEWNQELVRVEEEINTLRTVLASKVRHASDLKRKLGITVWKEITDDMNQGIKNVKESQVFHTVETKVGNIAKAVHDAPLYQRTESVLKTTAEKTSSLLGGITSGISSKFSQIKNSDSMRSLEDKMGSAYENVKTKVTTSRSNSVNSFNDSLHESNPGTTPTSPTIPEGKPIS